MCSLHAGSPKGADAASSGHRTPPEQAQQSGAEAGAPGGVPSTSAEWVEALVQQMAGASDVGEARVRAAEVLCAFEQAVLRKAGGELQVCTSCRVRSGSLLSGSLWCETPLCDRKIDGMPACACMHPACLTHAGCRR